MVDFGLKLEDNKVVEWGDKYIRYEILKAILKKSGHAVQRYKELAVKRPQEAFEITEAFRQGLPSRCASQNNSYENLRDQGSKSAPPTPSKTSLRSLTSLFEEQEKPSTSTNTAGAITSEETMSLKEQKQALGGFDGYGSTSSQTSGLVNIISKAASNVTDYFSQSYERSLRDTLKQVDKCANEFDVLLVEDVDRVNAFYREKMDELHARINMLKESVATTFVVNLQNMNINSNTINNSNNGNNEVPPPPPPQTDLKDLEGGQEQQQDQQQQSASTPTSSSTPTMSTSSSSGAMAAAVSAQQRIVQSRMTPTPAELAQLINTPLVHNSANRKAPFIAARALGRIREAVSGGANSTPVSTANRKKAPKVDNISFHNLGGEDDDQVTTSEREASVAAAGGIIIKKSTNKEEAERHAREVESIQRDLVDLYRRAKLLQNYCIINFTGFVKITKKHDKTLIEHKGRFKQLIQADNICNEGKEVELFTQHIEQLYANWFCDRNVSDAKVELLPKRGDGLEMDWSQLRLGYRMGMCSILGLWVCWDCIWGMMSLGQSTIGGRTAFPVFRACGGLLVLQWFWGCSVWTWTRYRVNYIYLFDFNPNIVNSPLAIFNEAVDNSLVFLSTMLLYYKAGAHDIPGTFPPGVFPLILVVYTILQFIFPLKTRAPMWKQIWLVVTTPMTSPVFFHSYIGDIFTSMVKVFQDLVWTFFFIGSGDWMIYEDDPQKHKHGWSKTGWYKSILIPLVTLAPLWFRFNQCLRRYADTGQRMPHIANAFKYALSMTVTLFGAFHPLYLHNASTDGNIFQNFWRLTFVMSSLYSFFWDVWFDWGLGRPRYNMLGPRLMYPKKGFYYGVICIDLVLRFAWVLTLVPPDSGASFALPAYLTAVSMMCELFRRTIWGFLRLENEHRSNTSGYRRVDFVPLHFTTGHKHDYKKEKERRGASVLVEIAIVTVLVLAAAVASVVAAQHETEKIQARQDTVEL